MVHSMVSTLQVKPLQVYPNEGVFEEGFFRVRKDVFYLRKVVFNMKGPCKRDSSLPCPRVLWTIL